MLSVILLSLLMILLSILNVIGHLVRGNNNLLNLNLIHETLWTGAGRGLLISMLEKLNWFCLTDLITLVLLMWKWMGLFLRKNYLLRCWGWLSLLNWIGALTLYLLLKLPQGKLIFWRRSTRYSDRLHDFSVIIPCCYKDVYVKSFFPRTARLLLRLRL